MSEIWRCLHDGPAAATWNMALDDLLLQRVASVGHPVLRFYSWSKPAATFGYFQHFAEVATWTPLRPLIRRPTGGGLVQHDRDWTYSLVFPPRHPWYQLRAVASYQALHDWLRRSFANLGATTQLSDCCQKDVVGQCFVGAEKFDLLWKGQKIAGAAQRRTRDGLLIQGSVQNIVQGFDQTQWQQAMCQTTPFADQTVIWHPLEWEPSWSEATAQLVESKYGRREYNEKR